MELTTFIVYFVVLVAIAFISYRRQQSDTDFVIGDRSLNFWLTALSAHASDMSSWLFLAYPAAIFTQGMFAAWAAIGLTVCMYLNWQFVAPRIRLITEQTNSLTMNAYFENRFADTTGIIRLIGAVMTLVFYIFYICSGLVAMGLLVESLFNLHYVIGISLGIFIVMLYVFMGGYRTVAWIDLFQGFFLLGVILFIPIFILIKIGGFTPVFTAIEQQNLSVSLFPDFGALTFLQIFLLAFGWGLGYFGQPHIITKFMGIKRLSDMAKSKYVGMSWQIIALFGATIIGLIGIYSFPEGVADPEKVILNLVQKTLVPFFSGLVLCAVLAATTNVMAAQILVVASSMSEDLYKKAFRKKATSKELLWASRTSVVIVSLISFLIAYLKIATIYKLVLYSWSGLGASFGPLLLASLYSKKINKFGAFSGILVGGLTAAIWPVFDTIGVITIPSMLPAFIFSLIAIYVVSALTEKKWSAEPAND